MDCLNKILWCIANPSTIGIVIIFAGLCFQFASRMNVGRRRTIGLCLICLSLFWFTVWSTSGFARIIGASLEEEFLVNGRYPAVESFPCCDAIADLGGGISADTNMFEHVFLHSSADRAYFSVLLWKAGKAPIIVPSGKGLVNSDRVFLAENGVPDSAIVVENNAKNTEENARFIAEILRNHSGDRKSRVLVVTSAWHMKRALLMFAKYAPNVEAIPAACDFECAPVGALSWKELMPNPEMFGRNSVYFHEWLGIIGYKLFRK